MNKFFNLKNIIFIFSLSFGIIFSLPSLFNFSGPKITLGLDLQGGLNIVLGVNQDEAIKAKYSTIASSINYQTRESNIPIDRLTSNKLGGGVSFELLDIDLKDKMDKILKEFNGLEINYFNSKYNLIFTTAEEKLIKNTTINQAIGTIRNRLDTFGLSEPTVARQGGDNILVQLPGIKTAEQEQKAIDLIIRPAHLRMMAVDESRVARVNEMSEEEATRYGDTILQDEAGNKLLLKSIPVLDGSMVSDARVGYDPKTNDPIISFTLNSEGAKIFANFSGNNIGKRMAVVLDNKVYSAPVIRERIGGGSGQISGAFTSAEASVVAIALRSGALNASLELLEKKSIGPSLGVESIKTSLVALTSAFLLIVVFMITYYGIAGLIAVSALFVNISLIVAVMAIFGATLTLPGMAGIVLTIGMAVDANIIINERIREALRAGKDAVSSIEFGYLNATRAIFDANNTTLIAALLLYIYGNGPLKGFAITMGIGIVASIITAIIGTHGVYLAIGNRVGKNLNAWFGVKLKGA